MEPYMQERLELVLVEPSMQERLELGRSFCLNTDGQGLDPPKELVFAARVQKAWARCPLAQAQAMQSVPLQLRPSRRPDVS